MMESEREKQNREEALRRSATDFFSRIVQDAAQKYELATAEQGIARLIEVGLEELVKREDERFSDPCLSAVYRALPALIRSRETLREVQQLEANALHMSLPELQHALKMLQLAPFERDQQRDQYPLGDFVSRERDLGEIWLETIASPARDTTEEHERHMMSRSIFHAARLLKKQIAPSVRRSHSAQQIVYLLCDPRLFQTHPGRTCPTNYRGIYMFDDPQQPVDRDVFPHGVRYVGRTSNLRRRMKLHMANSQDSGTADKRKWIAELLEEQLYPVIVIAERTEETTRLAEEREYRWILQSLRLGASLTNAEASYRHLVQACQTIAVESFLSEPFDLDAPSSVLWQILEAYGRDLRDRREQKRKKKVS